MKTRVEKWQQWIRHISLDCIELQLHVGIFRDIQEIVEANPRINKPNHFFSFLTKAHVNTVLMTLRRQVDNHKDCQSLLKLLVEISETPNAISREFYLGLMKNGSPEVLSSTENWFGEHASPDGSHFSQSIAAGDAAILRFSFETFQRLVDKRIAHFEPSKPLKKLPKMKEVDDAVETLRALVEKYYLLFTGASNDQIPSHGGWQSIFTEPWIPQTTDE